ncbi:MAG: glycosyltransferase family 4 protein [Clostridia bacterium]|nr:glycosyltransferase family 4 protein [Clostridia bacterium]
MKRVLFYAIYPAPYRAEILAKLNSDYQTDVFFEQGGGDDRNNEWFIKGKYNLLDTVNGKNVFKLCRKNLNQYDLAVIFDFSSLSAIKLIAKCRAKKVPYILNCDGAMLFKHGNFIRNAIKRFLVKGAAAYFASGTHARDYFLKYGAKEENINFHNFTALRKKDILGKPVSADEKIKIRKRLGLPTDAKICIAVGRYIPLKRYDILIRLWKEMPENTLLLLIGGGPEKANYERIINENNISNVILEGFHPFDELLGYYKAADIFVHPTSYDVWGLVINEAMACGLPIVVSDTCVAGRELVESGKNGYVVKLGDDAEFMNRIKELLSDDDLRSQMAVKSLEVIKPFYIENMIDSQIKTIDKTIEGKK